MQKCNQSILKIVLVNVMVLLKFAQDMKKIQILSWWKLIITLIIYFKITGWAKILKKLTTKKWHLELKKLEKEWKFNATKYKTNIQ